MTVVYEGKNMPTLFLSFFVSVFHVCVCVKGKSLRHVFVIVHGTVWWREAIFSTFLLVVSLILKKPSSFSPLLLLLYSFFTTTWFPSRFLLSCSTLLLQLLLLFYCVLSCLFFLMDSQGTHVCTTQLSSSTSILQAFLSLFSFFYNADWFRFFFFISCFSYVPISFGSCFLYPHNRHNNAQKISHRNREKK